MPQGKTIVAIDGPAGAGKSTVSRMLAERLGYVLVDTGALYRCIALMAQRTGALEDDAALTPLAEGLPVRFELVGGLNRVYLRGEDVTEAIRTPTISLETSRVSARPAVRTKLLDLQRRLALDAVEPGAVLEGRDIGTVVFPDAELKVFLDAPVDERARRRHQELAQMGQATSLQQVRAEIVERDAQDSQRAAAPLKRAWDAVLLDSTGLTPEQIVDRLAAWALQVRHASL
jgi:cytidylate kinase